MDLASVELFLLLALLHLSTQVRLSQQAASGVNVAFKTSFVSSSDYAVRRNGALISIPMANAEAQHQPDALMDASPAFDERASELSYLSGGSQDELANAHHTDHYQPQHPADEQRAKQVVGGYAQSQHEQPVVVLEVNNANGQDEATHYAQLDDLLAAQSSDTNRTAETRPPGEPATPTSTTSAPQTTFKQEPESTTTSLPPPSTPSLTSSTGANSTSTSSTSSINSTSSTSSTSALSTSSTGTGSTSTTTSAPTTTRGEPATTDEPKPVVSSSTVESDSGRKMESSTGSSTESSTTSRPTTTMAPQVETRTSKSQLESSSRELRRLKTVESDGPADLARGAGCKSGNPNCAAAAGGYIVAAVPLLDRWSPSTGSANQSTRLVSEFVFMPEDSPLNFEEAGYSTGKPGKEVEPSSLRAEHRTLDGDEAGGPEDDVELDYLTPELESLKSELRPASSSPAPPVTQPILATSQPPVRSSEPQSGSASTAPAPVSSTAKPPEASPTTTPRSAQTRASSTPTSAPTSTSTSTTTPTSSTSTSTSTTTTTTTTTTSTTPSPRPSTTAASVPPSVPPQRPLSSTTQAPGRTASESTPAPASSSPRPPSSAGRSNHKLLRIQETSSAHSKVPSVQVSSTSTTSTRPPTSRRPEVGARRTNWGDWSLGHRQFFSEPSGASRRRNNFSPVANGADEEEAKILTRHTIPSQLSRLSSAGQPLQPQQQVRREGPVRRAPSGQQVALESRRLHSSSQQATSAAPQPNRTQVKPEQPLEAPRPPARAAETASGGVVPPPQKPQKGVQSSGQEAISEPARSVASAALAQVKPSSPQSGEKSPGSGSREKERPVEQLLRSAPEPKPRESASEPTNGVGAAQQQPTVPTTTPISSIVQPSRQNDAQQVSARQEEVMTLISSSLVSPKSARELKLPSGVLPKAPQAHSTTTTTTSTTTSTARPPARLAAKIRTAVAPINLRRPSDELNEYEGSVEDQLAQDELHSGANQARRTSNAYGRARSAGRPAVVTPPGDSGRWQPSSKDESVQDEATSANLLPGRPGVDYPVHWRVPKTSFDCRNYELSGFYADVESDCQAYHSCHKGRGGRHTFLCPNGTLFSQELLTCDWWYNVECSSSRLYLSNEKSNSLNRSVGDGSVADALS